MPSTARASASSKGLMIVLLPIVFAVVAWLVVWPEYGRLKDAWASYDTSISLYDSKSILIKDVETLLAQHKNYQDDFALLKPALPSAPEVPQLMATLEEIATSTHMVLKNLSVTEESTTGIDVQAQATGATPAPAQPAGPQVSDLKVAITVSGTYQDFPIFLAALEKNIRLLEIEVLSSAQTSQSTGQSQELPSFKLVMSTYYQK